MRTLKALLVFALTLLAGLAGSGALQPVEATKLPVDCSGRASLCYEYSRCTEGGIRCTEWTITYWYWYR
jgi:hypothetical protein